MFTEADLTTMQGQAVALASRFPEEALLQMVRVYADALGRVAEAESRLFHFYVHERLRGEGLSGRQLMDTTHAVGEELRALMEPAILYFHTKGLAKSLEQDFVLHVAEESGLAGQPGRVAPARSLVRSGRSLTVVPVYGASIIMPPPE